MLHIPGISDCTYHLHVSVSVCSRFLAECQDYGRQPVEKRLLCACVPVRLARVHTPKLHLGGGRGGVVVV